LGRVYHEIRAGGKWIFTRADDWVSVFCFPERLCYINITMKVTNEEKPAFYTEEQAASVCYIQPTEELKKKLSPEEYDVLVKAATEPPFANAYWENHKDGIYVDRIDDTPLFASSTKFDSGTGWPSFWNPVDPTALVLIKDKSFGMTRTEVRAKKSGGHLGHLFDDGPKPSGLRYCINSASLRFVSKENMATEGFGEYLALFGT